MNKTSIAEANRPDDLLDYLHILVGWNGRRRAGHLQIRPSEFAAWRKAWEAA